MIANSRILNHIIPYQHHIFVHTIKKISTMQNTINTENFNKINRFKFIDSSQSLLCTSMKLSKPSISPRIILTDSTATGTKPIFIHLSSYSINSNNYWYKIMEIEMLWI